MAFTVRPAPSVEIKSAEVKETLDRAFTRANRYDSGFLLVTSGASLNATLEKGKALIGGATVGIDADSNEAITFAASTSDQGVYLLDDGTVSVATTDPVSNDFIKLWSADTDGTGVTATTDLRDTTLQFGSPIRSTRVVIDNAPTSGTHGTNKEYVDGEVAASGIKPVRAASTAALTLATDVENGDTLDGVTLATGDLILLKDQSTGSENGPWLVSATGAPTRPENFSASADVRGGTVFTVSEGTTNAHRAYILTTDDPITVGSTSLAFALHSVEGQRGTASGLATLTAGVHTAAERPAASTSVRGDALVGTATPGSLAAAAAVGASTTRWAREDHQHNHGDRSADAGVTHHSIAQLSDGGEIIQRDGSVAFTGDQSFGGNKATNLAEATAQNGAATLSQTSGFDQINQSATQPPTVGQLHFLAVNDGWQMGPNQALVRLSASGSAESFASIQSAGYAPSALATDLDFASPPAWETGDTFEIVAWLNFKGFSDLAAATDRLGIQFGQLLSSQAAMKASGNNDARIGVTANSSGNVTIDVADGSNRTQGAGGTAVVDSTWFKLYLKFIAGTSAEFSINDGATTTVSTNLPSRIGSMVAGWTTTSTTAEKWVAIRPSMTKWRFTPA